MSDFHVPYISDETPYLQCLYWDNFVESLKFLFFVSFTFKSFQLLFCIANLFETVSLCVIQNLCGFFWAMNTKNSWFLCSDNTGRHKPLSLFPGILGGVKLCYTIIGLSVLSQNWQLYQFNNQSFLFWKEDCHHWLCAADQVSHPRGVLNHRWFNITWVHYCNI